MAHRMWVSSSCMLVLLRIYCVLALQQSCLVQLEHLDTGPALSLYFPNTTSFLFFHSLLLQNQNAHKTVTIGCFAQKFTFGFLFSLSFHSSYFMWFLLYLHLMTVLYCENFPPLVCCIEHPMVHFGFVSLVGFPLLFFFCCLLSPHYSSCW